MPFSPPLPIAATIEAATGNVEVTFDRPLRGAALDHTNWFVAANITTGARQQVPQPGAVAVGTFVRFTTVTAGIVFPPLGIGYRPPPFDVLSSFGTPAAEFLDFPIAVI